MEVIRISLDLSETIFEGLEHIQKILGEGKFEQTIFLFEDVLEAFSSIERSIEPIIKKVDREALDEQLVSVKNALEIVVSTYEEKNYAKVQEVMQFTLRPQFKKFKAKIEEVFNPYLLS